MNTTSERERGKLFVSNAPNTIAPLSFTMKSKKDKRRPSEDGTQQVMQTHLRNETYDSDPNPNPNRTTITKKSHESGIDGRLTRDLHGTAPHLLRVVGLVRIGGQ